MDSFKFEVQGLRQLGEAMRQLSAATSRRVCAQATGSAAKVVKIAAQDNLRASPSVDTGSLLASIIIKKLPKAQAGGLDSAHIVTPRRRRTGSTKSRTKQKTAPHAHFVEFGTENMPAEPFLEPALSRNIAKATQVMKDRLQEGIAREAAKARKT